MPFCDWTPWGTVVLVDRGLRNFRAGAGAMERQMKKILISLGGLVAMAGVAEAHPGEHLFSIVGSFFHLLTEPDHLAMLAGAVAVAAGLFYMLKRRSV
jgi:hypothetical protein